MRTWENRTLPAWAAFPHVTLCALPCLGTATLSFCVHFHPASSAHLIRYQEGPLDNIYFLLPVDSKIVCLCFRTAHRQGQGRSTRSTAVSILLLHDEATHLPLILPQSAVSGRSVRPIMAALAAAQAGTCFTRP